MNVLFVSAKKRWAGVLTWYVSISRKLEADGHKCFIVSAKNSAFTEHSPDDLNVTPLKYGFDYNPLTLLFFKRFIKKHKIGLVITNTKREVISGGLPAKMLGVPVIRRIGNEKDFRDCRNIEKKYVDRELFVCGTSRNNALEQYKWLEPKRTEVIHTGKQIPQFSKEDITAKRNSWNVKDDTIIIGISDRLSRFKGIDVLIKAYSVLVKEFENIKLVITGKGNYENELKGLVTELGLGDKVHFAGFTTEVMLTAASYDIAVLASFEESFPNTVVEYMACGIPVVCTKVGGVHEIVKNGHNGFLIDSKDQTQLEDALRKLIADKKLREEFGKNAFETVRQGFTEDIMYEKTLELFRKTAGTK